MLRVHAGQVLEALSDLGLVELFADCQRTLVQPLGFGIFALMIVRVGKIVENLSHVRVAWAERLLLDRECALVQSLGISVFALRRIHDGQAIERDAIVGVVDAKTCLRHRLERLRLHERRRIVARRIKFLEMPDDRVEIAYLLTRSWHDGNDREQRRAR